MNDTSISLKWGHPLDLPDTATAAWGARLIDYSGSKADLVWDRQDLDGPDKDTLLHKLNDERVLKQILDTIDEFRLTYFEDPNFGTPSRMRPDVREDFVVHDEGGIIAVANTNASYGYVYVTAFYIPPTEEV